MRPLILLTNDDGVMAKGLRAMAEALASFADVVVCAPQDNQSATSHSLSLNRVLRLRTIEPGFFGVDGTPADSVFVALESGGRVLTRAPDLCVSGINHGLNLGVDVFYSGTVAAAREAALRGIPAFAFSADTGAELREVASFLAKLVEVFWRTRAPGERPVLFNANVPATTNWRCRPTVLGRRTYEGGVVFRNDPRGAEYMWIGGGTPRHHAAPGSDTEAYDEGEIGITALSLDLSDAKGAPAVAALCRAAAPPSDP